MKKKRLLLIVICVVVLSLLTLAYWQPHRAEPNTYISLTATSTSGECHFYCYDIATGELTESYKTADTAQYPLGVVDQRQSCVYFAQRINRGDQLMCYDIQTKQVLQLTENIYAINQIIPQEEKVYLIASTFDHPRLALIEYDLQQAAYEILTPISDMVMQMTYDVKNDAIIYAAYDWQKQRDLQAAYEQRDRTRPSVAENAGYALYCYAIATKETTLLAEVDELIATMDVGNDGNTFIMRMADSLFEPRQNVIWSLADKQVLETLAFDQAKQAENLAFSPDMAGCYFTGILSELQESGQPSPPNELIYMDFSTGKYEHLVSFEDKYINNFWICKS